VALNTPIFALFFIPFFLLYYSIFGKTAGRQNLFLLLGCYAFYFIADQRFLPFILAVSAINFFLGFAIGFSNRRRSFYLILGLIVSLGSLAYFKYCNFFISSISDLLHLFGMHADPHLLNIAAPLGVSFFTFRTVSYLLDIYYGRIDPETNWVKFFNYVAFFPAIIAGPIDRARPFMAQNDKPRRFDRPMASDGMRQIVWGLFKKMVIADNCALFTNQVFDPENTLAGSTMAIGLFMYAMQMYADFSGYTDMAIGISKLLGFNISPNFRYPFFAESVIEYWRRWHISLTRWLTDYVFTPLTIRFRNLGKTGLIFAIIINMVAVGIWHGPAWTYAAFGLLHGLYFVPYILSGAKLTPKKQKNLHLTARPTIRQTFNMLLTFFLVCMAFVLFRAGSINEAAEFYKGLFSSSLFSLSGLKLETNVYITLAFIALMLIAEWLQRDREYALDIAKINKKSARLIIYWAVTFITLFFSAGAQTEFIYAQF